MSDYDPMFDRALAVVLSHEGGFVNNPSDPGGATNFGISLRWLKEIGMLDLDGDGHPEGDLNLDGHIDLADIKELTRDGAANFYRRHWWDKNDYGSLPLIVAVKLFDLAVNMGATQAHKVLQRSCRACGQLITDDGVLGPKSRAAVRGVDTQTMLVAAMRSEAAGFYRGLVSAKPSLGVFLNGWLNRAYS